ncbi:hypothetical protein SAMN05216226_11740 [Halovenus aranensis]|uniref:Uncharacterized protein n=1 Tax=Halovenus aranensis TaxID=890420 RepID=A0A1G8Z143_9EURY|nr:hypothetical protein [Halovenus aranensis]SDK08788.1 hypothetical protein SAMN05216226_11740 [Halovenus aranensis]
MDTLGEDSPFDGYWQDLLDDTAATANEYEENGWDTLALTPGDVTPRYDSEKPDGLSVLVPDSEYDHLADLTEQKTFDSVEVYKNTGGPMVFLLVVEKDVAAETAVLIPAYYNAGAHAEFVETIESLGEMPIHVRALGGDEALRFVHDSVPLFTPDEE